MNFAVISRKGPYRSNNEDAYFADPNGMLVVADGMGGHRFGEVASRIAVERVKKELIAKYRLLKEKTEETMVAAVRRANDAILGKVLDDPRLSGMGTTILVGFMNDMTFHTVNVGDSRAYLITPPERIRQLTEDHTLVQQLVGVELTDSSQARNHPIRGVLTRSLGYRSDLLADYKKTCVNPRDYLLLCTDGLSEALSESEILAQIRPGTSLGQSCRRLVEKAYKLGCADNVTVIIVKVS